MPEQTVRSEDLSIGELLKDFYVVPSYQREYVWSEANVEQLLTDISTEFPPTGTSGTPPEYFLGSIVVCAQPGKDNVYELIDGQQRMTTCYLVLCAMRDRLTALQKTSATLRGQIAATATNLDTGEDEYRFRVQLQYEDSGDVLERIAKGDHGARAYTTVSLENIWNAYDTILETLRDQFGDDAAELLRFYAYFTTRVKLIRVRTASVSHALRVFETINDRGVGLDAMDLLKNLMFMHAKPAQFEKLKVGWKALVDTIHGAKEKPLRFLRYYIFADHDVDRLQEEGIYEWFTKNEKVCGYKENPIQFVQRLNKAAAAYAHFLDGKDPHGKPNRYVSNIRFMSGAARQHLIPFLAARDLPQECFSELARQVENMFFAYVICREQAKQLERLFATTASAVRSAKDLDDIKAVAEKYFTPQKKELADRFALSFNTLNESDIQKYRLRYVLAKLTQHLNESAWANSSQYTDLGRFICAAVEIEHILPQLGPTPDAIAAFGSADAVDKYVRKLGNLALLEKPINASIQHKPLADKKKGYAQSEFVLTKAIAEKPSVGLNTSFDRAVRNIEPATVWNAAAVDKRQQYLAQLAFVVWDMPKPSSEATT
jgi:uncharacterized protein with ParB-like and HNH nuclease domain